ncbi:MAG: hypothetical protein PHH24_02800 [Candidatus Moranbacteria bacterium]|jgi:hypothetical protein|nr:hypothetical protein [Candidatus Moranbacteria bacterium]MDD5651960.1 hypothetical protein [Candidatus Moranbacteria bacterium]MDX9855897.1 hypothetical protein [Candidatus Moranbacteria bacterium]
MIFPHKAIVWLIPKKNWRKNWTIPTDADKKAPQARNLNILTLAIFLPLTMKYKGKIDRKNKIFLIPQSIFPAVASEKILRNKKDKMRKVTMLPDMEILLFFSPLISHIKKIKGIMTLTDAKSIPSRGFSAIWKGKYKKRRDMSRFIIVLQFYTLFRLLPRRSADILIYFKNIFIIKQWMNICYLLLHT